jgi:hypothetical protein
MTVADKIKQRVAAMNTKRERRFRPPRRLKPAELWTRDQRIAMSKLADEFLKDKHDGQEI